MNRMDERARVRRSASVAKEKKDLEVKVRGRSKGNGMRQKGNVLLGKVRRRKEKAGKGRQGRVKRGGGVVQHGELRTVGKGKKEKPCARKEREDKSNGDK